MPTGKAAMLPPWLESAFFLGEKRMTSQNNPAIDLDSACVEPSAPSATSPTPPQARLSFAQFERWADLVVRGETPFPAGLVPEERERLWREVCHRRRDRLVHFIARAIAQDIVRECEP